MSEPEIYQVFDEISKKIINGKEIDNSPSVNIGDEYVIFVPLNIYSIMIANEKNNNALIDDDGKIRVKVVGLFGRGYKENVEFYVYNNIKNEYVGMNSSENQMFPFIAPSKTHRLIGIGINQLALYGRKINGGGKNKTMRTNKRKMNKRKMNKNKTLKK